MRASAPDNRPRGAVIAFVGPDGSGKSTLSGALMKGLGDVHSVTRLHLGGPPRGTWLTRGPRVVVRALRKIPRLLRRERTLEGVAARYPVFQATLDVFTALDRAWLVSRCHRSARRGVLVFTDRYPGRDPGSASGPALRARSTRLTRVVRGLEVRIYRAMPLPHLVVRVDAPEEVTVLRNAARARPKPEHVIRSSHARAAALRFPGVHEIRVDGTGPLADTIERLTADVARWVDSR